MELDGGDAGTPLTTLGAVSRPLFPNNASLALRLDEPLVPGRTYRLTASNRCKQFGGDDAGRSRGEKTVSFSAGPASALPGTIGSADVIYLTGTLGGRYGFNAEGRVAMWGRYAPVAVAQITIHPSAELQPYLPLTRFSTYVDGVLWGESHYGRGTASYEAAPDQVTFRDFTRVYATCLRDAADSACESSGVAVGSHEVELRAHVAGAATEPTPLRFQIHLSCPGDAGVPDASGAGGAPGGGRGDRNDDDGGGCAIARSRARNDAHAVSLAALVFSGAAWRRRRKHFNS